MFWTKGGVLLDIGNKIKILRLSHTWTQKHLASQLGLTPKMISFYENNERVPPADILVKLSKIFDVSTDYLLGLTDEIHSQINSKKISVNGDENTLISIYRKLDKDYQDIVIGDLKKYMKMQEYMQAAHSPHREKKQA